MGRTSDILAYRVFLERQDPVDAVTHLAKRLIQVVIHSAGEPLDRASLIQMALRVVDSPRLKPELLNDVVDKCLEGGVLVRRESDLVGLGAQASRNIAQSLETGRTNSSALRDLITGTLRRRAASSSGDQLDQAGRIVEEHLVEALWDAGFAAASIVGGQRLDCVYRVRRAEQLEEQIAGLVGGRSAALIAIQDLLSALAKSDTARTFMVSTLRTIFSLQILGMDPRAVALKRKYLAQRVFLVDTNILMNLFFHRGLDLSCLVAEARDLGVAFSVSSATCSEFEDQIRVAKREAEHPDPLTLGIVARRYLESGVRTFEHFADTYLPADRFLQTQGFECATSSGLSVLEYELEKVAATIEQCKVDKLAAYGRVLAPGVLEHDLSDLCHVAKCRQDCPPDPMGHKIWYLTMDSCISRHAPHLALMPHELAALLVVNEGAQSEQTFVELILNSMTHFGTDNIVDDIVYQMVRSSGIEVPGLAGQPFEDVERIVGRESARTGAKGTCKPVLPDWELDRQVAEILLRVDRLTHELEEERREHKRALDVVHELLQMPWWRRLFWKGPPGSGSRTA